MSASNSTAGHRGQGVPILLGTGVIASAWLEFFIVRHHTAFGVLSIVLAVAAAVLALRRRRPRGWLLLAGLGGLSALLQLLWITTSLYPLWIAAFIATLALGLAHWLAAWRSRRRDQTHGATKVRRGALRGIALLGAAVATVLSIAFVAIAITPAPLAIALQSSGGAGNSFEPAAPTETKVVRGTRLTNDIQYGTTYPNSYLDIYIADDDPSVSRPTFLVVHGGGFILGSKSDGDPNAVGADDSYFALGSGPVLDAGYNVVSIDYALAPQVPYPTPVIQLGQAVQFLQQHGAQYGVDMSRVVLSGGSAGGHIVGQYAAIQTNPDYAKQMDIAPTMDPAHLKAAVFDSAALIPSLAGHTQEPVLARDWSFDLALRSYIGTSRDLVEQANIVTHVTSAFPPSFLADGNTGTFPDQATQLSHKLTSLGVKNSLDIPPVSQAVLGHGFMATPSLYTEEYNREKLAFLAAVVR